MRRRDFLKGLLAAPLALVAGKAAQGRGVRTLTTPWMRYDASPPPPGPLLPCDCKDGWVLRRLRNEEPGGWGPYSERVRRDPCPKCWPFNPAPTSKTYPKVRWSRHFDPDEWPESDGEPFTFDRD